MNMSQAGAGLSKLKITLAALAAACLILAFGAAGAKAAPEAGDPFVAEFNYVGLNVDVTIADFDELVLTPESEDADGHPLPPLRLKGTYTDDEGNFELKKADGLEFPDLDIDLEAAVVSGEIELAEDSTGNYDAVTGAMDLNLKLSLTLGADEVADMGLPFPGSGRLGCKFSPLDVNFSTSSGWPHAGRPFGTPASIEDGAIAGSWTYSPKVVTTAGDAFLCTAIAGLLSPVGGIWMAHEDPNTFTEMPDATESAPAETRCVFPVTGKYPDCVPIPCPDYTEGVNQPDCAPIPCPEGTTGDVQPDCVKINVGKGKLKKLQLLAPKKVKQGKKFTVRMKVKNVGKANLTNVRLCLKTQKKFIRGTGKRCRTLSNLAVGKTKAVKLNLKSKRLKGNKRAKLTAVVAKSGKVLRKNKRVTLLKQKKNKKRR